jgi:hypothetical protein
VVGVEDASAGACFRTRRLQFESEHSVLL